MDYLASPTPLVLFFSFLFVCAELLQKKKTLKKTNAKKQEQEFEHLPDVLTRLISPRLHVISGASRKNNHCLNALSAC